MRTASLHGQVTDEHRAALPNVQVSLSAIGVANAVSYSATTDSGGRFAWTGIPAGSYRLNARRLGFEQVTAAVALKDGEDEQEDIRMTAVAQRLDTVSVVGQSLTPERYGTSSRMDEFFRRKNEGRGHFFTRDQIDSTDANTTATLLSRVPGVRSRREVDGTIYVQVATCFGTNGLRPGPGDDWGWEHVALYVDGVPIGKGSRSAVFSTLMPAEIEGMEVYRGSSEIPLEAQGDACAAVYVWTKGGN